MKRFLSLFLCLVFTAVLLLTGCGAKNESSADGQGDRTDQTTAAGPAASDEKATVTHYAIAAPDKEWIKEVMPDFEKAHPNITMKFLTVPYENFDTKLKTMIAGGTPPDVTTHYGSGGFIEYLGKDMILDLTPIMEKANYVPSEAGIPDNLTDIYKVDGKYYGIPVSAYVSMIFYNKDLFDKAKVAYPTSDYEDKAWTFDAMVEMAKKLTVNADKLENKQFGLKFDEWADKDMRPVYFGAKVYSDDTWTNGGYPSECYFGSEDVIKATQRMIDLVYADKVAPTQSEVNALAASGDTFTSGKLGMYVTGAWALNFAKDYTFQVGVAAIPDGGNEKARDVLYVDPLMILKGCNYPDQAFEWIKYLTSKEVQEIALEKAANPPANEQALEKYFNSVKGVDPADMKRVYEGGIKYGAESTNHLVSNASQIITIIGNELAPCENDGAPAAEYCKKAGEKVNELLQKSKK